jgi:hypothetical protein
MLMWLVSILKEKVAAERDGLPLMQMDCELGTVHGTRLPRISS